MDGDQSLEIKTCSDTCDSQAFRAFITSDMALASHLIKPEGGTSRAIRFLVSVSVRKRYRDTPGVIDLLQRAKEGKDEK